MMFALLLLTAVQEPDFTSRPVCDEFRQEHGRCEAGLRGVERAQEANARCGRQAADALAGQRRPDVSARRFADQMGAVSARCSRERADCIATSLDFSNHFTLSERMRVESAVENCEDRFWQAVIVRSGAPGRSYRDVRDANAPDR
jgi:hypothetical protein